MLMICERQCQETHSTCRKYLQIQGNDCRRLEKQQIMIGEPIVSIGLPVYNGEQYIRRALDFLLAQDYDNFEIIISDNASTDSTPKICREYAEKYPSIRFHSNAANIGVLANFEIVLGMAKGSYFMWAADDDRWSPNFVTTLVNELEGHPYAGIAMCAVKRVKGDGNQLDVIRFYGRDDPNRKNHFKMAMALAAPPKKYNLFIYGLFRTHLLKGVMSRYSDHSWRERLLLCPLALASRFRYVDKILFSKTVYDNLQKRKWRSQDPDFNINKGDIAGLVKWITLLSKAVFKSSSITWYRKLYVVGPIYGKIRWKFSKISFKSVLLNKIGLKKST